MWSPLTCYSIGMKKAPPKPKGYLALFATILVVAGVVAVAFVAAPRKTAQPPKTDGKPQQATSTASGPALLIADGLGARFVIDGKERPAKWPYDTNLLGQPLSTLVGRHVLTGEPAYFLPEFVLATSSAGIRSPDGRRSLHSAPARRDGAGAVEVRYGSESHTYVLRLANGRAVKDVNPIGWWDSETMAATGYVTTTRILFSVNLSGVVEQIAVLPDTINFIRAENGSVRYVEVRPGEGLESEPRPPSSLHRVSRDGTEEVVAEESDRIILGYVTKEPQGISGTRGIAYQTDDGRAISIGEDGHTKDLGSGMPLGFTDDSRVVLKRGAELIAVYDMTGEEWRVADAPGDDGAVFVIPSPAVDASPEIK